MKQLRKRIIRLLESADDGGAENSHSSTIADNEEKEKLQYLKNTKKWNPYRLSSRICSKEKGKMVNEFQTRC
jgi:hypothetical protein